MKKDFIIGCGIFAAFAIIAKHLFFMDMAGRGGPFAAQLGALTGALLLPGIIFFFWYKFRDKKFVGIFFALFILLTIVQFIK